MADNKTKLSDLLLGILNNKDPMTDTAELEQPVDASSIRVVKEKEEQDKKKSIADEKLIKAVQALTKTLIDKDKKDKKDGIGGYLQDKMAGLKKLFSVEGIAGTVGIEKNDGSLMGAVLGSATKKKDKLKEQAAFTKQYTEYTVEGQNLTSIINDPKASAEEKKAAEKQLTTNAVKKFDTLSTTKKDIARYEQKQSEAKAFGGILNKEDQKQYDDAIAVRESILSEFKGSESTKEFVEKQQSTNESLKESTSKETTSEESLTKEQFTREFVAGVLQGMKDEYNSLTPAEQAEVDKANPEVVNDIINGSIEELLSLEKEQLDAILKLVDLQTGTEEDRLEAATAVPVIPTLKQEEKDKDKDKGGLFNIIKDLFLGKLPKIFGGIFGAVMPLIGGILAAGSKLILGGLSAAMGLASGILGGGLKKLGGFAAGAIPAATSLATKAGGLISTVADKTKGLATKGLDVVKSAGSTVLDKGGSLLTTVADKTKDIAKGGIEAVKKTTSAVGEKVAEVATKKAGAQAAETAGKGLTKSLLKKIPGIGLLVGGVLAAGRLMDGDITGAGLEMASGAASTLPGAGTAASFAIDGVQMARDISRANEVVEKIDVPARVSQKNDLEKSEAEHFIATNSTEPNRPPSSPVVVNNSSTNVNNNTTKVINRVPVRNMDTTYNNRLSYLFS